MDPEIAIETRLLPGLVRGTTFNILQKLRSRGGKLQNCNDACSDAKWVRQVRLDTVQAGSRAALIEVSFTRHRSPPC